MKLNSVIIKTAIIDAISNVLDREVKACSIVALVKDKEGNYVPDSMFIGSSEDIQEAYKRTMLEQESGWLEEALTDAVMDVWEEHGELTPGKEGEK